MYCTNCGKELEKAFILCPFCGQKIEEKAGQEKADVQITAEVYKPQENKLFMRDKSKSKRKIIIVGAAIVAAVITIIILISRNGTMQDIPVYSKMDPRTYVADLYDIELFLKTEYGETALDYSKIYEYLPLSTEVEGFVLVKYQEENQNIPVYHVFVADIKGTPFYQPGGYKVGMTNEIISDFDHTPIIRKEEIALPDGDMGWRVSFEAEGGFPLWSCEVQMDPLGRVSKVYNLNGDVSVSYYINQIALASSINNPYVQINYDEKGRVKDISIQELNKTGANTSQTVLKTEHTTQDLMESIRYSTEYEDGTILFKYGDNGERIQSVEEGFSLRNEEGDLLSEVICEYDAAKRLSRVQLTTSDGEVSSMEFEYKKQKRMLRVATRNEYIEEYDEDGNRVY